jgi:hypothetical protein
VALLDVVWFFLRGSSYSRSALRKEQLVKHTTLLAIAGALALSACASEPVVVAKWSRPGADRQAFVDVRAQCVRNVRSESAAWYVAGVRSQGTGGVLGELADDLGADFGWRTTGAGLDRDGFQRCMHAHGWSLDPKGFAPDDGDEVAMGY